MPKLPRRFVEGVLGSSHGKLPSQWIDRDLPTESFAALRRKGAGYAGRSNLHSPIRTTVLGLYKSAIGDRQES